MWRGLWLRLGQVVSHRGPWVTLSSNIQGALSGDLHKHPNTQRPQGLASSGSQKDLAQGRQGYTYIQEKGPSPALPHHNTPTYLGLALEVESQHVFPRPSLTLADHKEAVAPGPACQHQLGGLDPGQCPVEPGVVAEFQLGLCLRVRLRPLLASWGSGVGGG